MSRLLKIPEAVSLALHAMALLARHPGERLTTAAIAADLGASAAHLAKVLKILEHQGYVHALRGPAGGFQIAAEADEITLMEIYTALEGPLDTGGCLLSTPICGGKKMCLFGATLRRLENEFRTELETTTLASLARTLGVRHAEKHH